MLPKVPILVSQLSIFFFSLVCLLYILFTYITFSSHLLSLTPIFSSLPLTLFHSYYSSIQLFNSLYRNVIFTTLSFFSFPFSTRSQTFPPTFLYVPFPLHTFHVQSIHHPFFLPFFPFHNLPMLYSTPFLPPFFTLSPFSASPVLSSLFQRPSNSPSFLP